MDKDELQKKVLEAENEFNDLKKAIDDLSDIIDHKDINNNFTSANDTISQFKEYLSSLSFEQGG